MKKIKIKASQVDNLTDARYFAALGVEWLGFNLDLSSDQRMAPSMYYAIREWVEGPKMLAEIGKTPLSLFLEVFDVDSFDCVQSTNKEEHQDQIIVLQPEGLEEIESLSPSEVYLLDLNKMTEPSIYSQVDILIELCDRFNLIFPVPKERKNVLVLIEKVRPFGIEVKGGAEEKVGYKSFEELDEFFEMLKAGE